MEYLRPKKTSPTVCKTLASDSNGFSTLDPCLVEGLPTAEQYQSTYRQVLCFVQMEPVACAGWWLVVGGVSRLPEKSDKTCARLRHSRRGLTVLKLRRQFSWMWRSRCRVTLKLPATTCKTSYLRAQMLASSKKANLTRFAQIDAPSATTT